MVLGLMVNGDSVRVCHWTMVRLGSADGYNVLTDE